MLSIEELVKKFPAAAEYLIEIFTTNRDYGEVKNSVIALRLGVSKPAVTQAMNRLKKYNLIEQDLYGKIKMTEVGRVMASRFLERHYLLEHLLISQLGYHWVKSDIEASRLQSSVSDEFAAFLFEKLGRPDTCPHGNPFPGAESESVLLHSLRLSAVKKGEKLKLARITEEGEARDGLLLFCYEHNLKPGFCFRIVQSGEDLIRIEGEQGRAIDVPVDYARYICCIK